MALPLQTRAYSVVSVISDSAYLRISALVKGIGMAREGLVDAAELFVAQVGETALLLALPELLEGEFQQR